jgi:hypothetical protein
LNIHQATDRLKPKRPRDFDPGLLIVDSFLTEEQEQRILEEVAQELEGQTDPEQQPDTEEPHQSRSSSFRRFPNPYMCSLLEMVEASQRLWLSESPAVSTHLSWADLQALVHFNGFTA